ncbi:MAG: branched-chain amino acid transporter permease [Candidatus Onthomonas sp.]
MSTVHTLLIIAVMALVTVFTRALPFLLFDHGERPPRWIDYLGQVLPPAIMALLVVYCLRNIDLLAGTHGLPELICVAVAALLHLWKGNTLVSIFGATALYMTIIRICPP